MASLQAFRIKFSNSINVKSTYSLVLKVLNSERFYSIFPSTYIKPIYKKDEQQKLVESNESKVIMHLPIKPAFSNETSSEFHDPIVNKFINYLNKEGKKLRARNLIESTFENIKRIQLERYNRSTHEEKAKIELDPKVILYKAIENSTPVLELLKMKRGGRTYQVPVPVTEKRASFLAMNWLLAAGREKERTVRFPIRLAYELVDAHNNQGRVIRKKQELYRQCEANRSYAHFRWQ